MTILHMDTPYSRLLTEDQNMAYLLANVFRLALYSYSGDARQVDKSQVRNIRGADLQTDEVVADPHSLPSQFILS